MFGLLTSLALGDAAAQPPPGRPTYEPMRYDEDWSALLDPSRRMEPWDAIKAVSLGRPDWFLTVAGEARERYELLDQPAFGFGTTDHNGYLLQRFLLSSDWHLGSRVRAFTELQSGLTHGRSGLAVPSLTNRLDIHQAFLDVVPMRTGRREVRMRAGRQELALGSGRLVSAAEGLNVRRSFDGVRVIVKERGWTLNAGVFRLVKQETGLFDDRSDPDLSYWGVGAIGRHRRWAGAGLSVYYFGVDRRGATFADGTARSVRHTLGSRSWRSGAGPWDFNYEVVLQWGAIGDRSIRAWGLSTDTGYLLTGRLRTRVGLRADVTSGDRRRGDDRLGSYDPLFPSAISYSGNSGLLGPTNLVAIGPTVRLSPLPRVTLTVSAPAFWRQSSGDGVYLITTTPLPQLAPSGARSVGANPDIALSWSVGRHVLVTALASRFMVGSFLRETTPGQPVNYAFTAVQYRF